MRLTPFGWICTALFMLATASHAVAQTAGKPPPAAPRWFASLGAASMTPLHGDDYPEGGVIIGSLGVRASKHLLIEIEGTRRAAERRYVETDVFLFGGPGGVPGRAGRIESGTDTEDWTLGANFIARTTGRLSVFGGGCPSLHRQRTRDFRDVTNCTPPAPSSGAPCTEFDREGSSMNVGLQTLAGVEARLHPRLVAFVAGRFEWRPGLAYGSAGVMGGVRVFFR